MVGKTEVEEILFDELTGAGHVGVVHLLVERRAAVAREATRTAVLRFGEGQLRPAALWRVEGAVVSGQEPVPGRVPGHRDPANPGSIQTRVGGVGYRFAERQA